MPGKPLTIGYFNDLLGLFVGIITQGYGSLRPSVLFLFGALCSLELIFFGLYYALGKEDLMKEIFPKILWMSLIFGIIMNLPTITSEAIKSANAIGKKIAPSTFVNIAEPSSISQWGTLAATNFFDYADSLGIRKIGKILSAYTTGIVIFLCFVFMAIQAFIAILEFYFISLLSLLILPFSCFRYTTWISQGVFKAFVAQILKLATLAVIISISSVVSDRFGMAASDPKMVNIATAFGLMGTSILIAYLAYSVPNLAGGLITGQPSLHAGGAVSLAAGGVVGGFAAGGAVMSGASKVASVAGGPVGTAISGMARVAKSGLDKTRSAIKTAASKLKS